VLISACDFISETLTGWKWLIFLKPLLCSQ